MRPKLPRNGVEYRSDDFALRPAAVCPFGSVLSFEGEAYLERLAEREGRDIAKDDDLRWYAQRCISQGKKKLTQEEWESTSDPDARIGRMKDVTTHLN